MDGLPAIRRCCHAIPVPTGTAICSCWPARHFDTASSRCLSWPKAARSVRAACPAYTRNNNWIFSAIGQTIAHMHNVHHLAGACRLRPAMPGISTASGLNLTWGRFETSPFSMAPAGLVLQARDKAMKALSEHERSARNFGIIYADLVRETCSSMTAVRIIDFDDCGHGWHMYDGHRALQNRRRRSIR